MMNDRIKEFVSQSHLDVYGLGKDKEKWEATVDKFAELIVQECLEACSRANEIRHFVQPLKQQVVLDCMLEIEKVLK
jgi:hypothetical protein